MAQRELMLCIWELCVQSLTPQGPRLTAGSISQALSLSIVGYDPKQSKSWISEVGLGADSLAKMPALHWYTHVFDPCALYLVLCHHNLRVQLLPPHPMLHKYPN